MVLSVFHSLYNVLEQLFLPATHLVTIIALVLLLGGYINGGLESMRPGLFQWYYYPIPRIA